MDNPRFDMDKYKAEYDEFWAGMKPVILGSTGGMTGWGGRFLYAVARTIKATMIFEIGTRNGMSATTFCRALTKNGGGEFTTCDVKNVTAGEAKGSENFPLTPDQMVVHNKDYENVLHFIQGRGADVLRLIEPGTLDIVLIDGSHGEKDMIEELPLALDALREGGVLICDDVYPNGKRFGDNTDLPGPWSGIMHHVEEGLIDGFVRPDENQSIAYIVKGESHA